ncbi:MAG: hypothetical protein K2N37_04830 [Lachnospiraceae bacterium]|nr:hypothetical protein [Lachnospiraceae bacterium]
MCHIFLHNALAYTPEGSSVRLFIPDIISEKEISIGVQDNGPGIPDEEKPKIFDRFYRVNRNSSATGKEKGHHGLGLAVAKEIVAAHKGTLSVADGEGGGAVFLVTLPLQ